MSDQTPKLQIVNNEEDDASAELSRIVKRDGTQVISIPKNHVGHSPRRRSDRRI